MLPGRSMWQLQCSIHRPPVEIDLRHHFTPINPHNSPRGLRVPFYILPNSPRNYCSYCTCPSSVLSSPSFVLSSPRSVLSYPCSVISSPSSVLSCTVLSCSVSVMSSPSSVLCSQLLTSPNYVLSYPCSVLSFPSSVLSSPSCPAISLFCPLTARSWPSCLFVSRHLILAQQYRPVLVLSRPLPSYTLSVFHSSTTPVCRSPGHVWVITDVAFRNSGCQEML